MTKVKCNNQKCIYCDNLECQRATIEIIYEEYDDYGDYGSYKVKSYMCGSNKDETMEESK